MKAEAKEKFLELRARGMSLFPEKLVFENGSYRTTKMNEAVELIGQFQRELGEKKRRTFFFFGKNVRGCALNRTHLEPICRGNAQNL